MKKKILAKTTAITLAATMAMSTMVFAAPEEVPNTVLGPGILEVVMPATAALAVDPFQIATSLTDGQGGQIASPNYYMVNESVIDAVVTVEVKLKAVSGEGVILVGSKDELAIDDMDIEADDKRFTLGLIAAKTTTKTLGAAAAVEYDDDYVVYGTYDDKNLPSVRYLLDGEEGVKSRFVLDAATQDGEVFAYEEDDTYIDIEDFAADTLGTKGVSAFKFYGNVNAYANWQNDDITVEFIADYAGIRASYLETANIADGTIGLLTEPAFVQPTIEIAKANIETADLPALAALKLNVPTGSKVAEVYIDDEPLTITTQYVYTPGTKALAIKKALGDAETEVGTEFVIGVLLDDEETYIETVVVVIP